MAEKDDKLSWIRKATGTALISVGGLMLAKDLHLFEKSTFDSVVHVEFPAEPAIPPLTATAGGVGLSCRPDWIIDDFATGWRRHLGKTASQGIVVEPADTDPRLDAAVQRVVDSLAEEAAGADVLLLGNTDPRSYETNASLARERAEKVKDLMAPKLEAKFKAKGGADSAGPNIIVLNGQMTMATRPGEGLDPKLAGGLARALFGTKERSGRSVFVCALERGQTLMGAAGTPQLMAVLRTAAFYRGLAGGVIVGGLLIGVGISLPGLFAWLAAREKREKEPPKNPKVPAAPPQ